MKNLVGAAIATLLLTLPAEALALATETFGNAPVVKQTEWADGVLDVVNQNSRVYSNWVNGNENFFYKGEAADLNETVRKYAAIKDAPRRLIVLPGPGKRQSFQGKRVDFDWHLHVPSGIYKAMTREAHAVLTVYLNAATPRGLKDRERVTRWIGELDDDSFETRQKAEDELARLGYDAKPLLREALKARKELEVRRRVERLLKKLPGLDAGDLEVPKGVVLVTPEDLLADHTTGLKAADHHVCARAVQGLSELAAISDQVVPSLIGMLKKEKHEYVRRVAAGSLARLGAMAKPAVAALKEGLGDADANVRNAFQSALDQIEKAKAEPGDEEETKRKVAILRDISEWKKAATK